MDGAELDLLIVTQAQLPRSHALLPSLRGLHPGFIFLSLRFEPSGRTDDGIWRSPKVDLIMPDPGLNTASPPVEPQPLWKQKWSVDVTKEVFVG